MGKRILLVDDEPLILKGLKYTLEQEGYETESAMDGEEALAMFESGGFDLILLDEDIQDLEWREVLGNLRAMSWIKMPVIFLMSGRTSMAREIEGTGVSHVLQKPFYFSALHRLAEQAFEERKDAGQADDQTDDYSLEGLRFLAAEEGTAGLRWPCSAIPGRGIMMPS